MIKNLVKLDRILSLLLAVVVVVLINIIALTNSARVDLSSRQFYKLSERTIGLLKGLDKTVKVYVLFHKDDRLRTDIENLLDEFQYYSRNVEVEWVDPSSDMSRAKELAKKYSFNTANVVVFVSDGRHIIKKVSDIAAFKKEKNRKEPVYSAFKGEQAFFSAIQELLQEKRPAAYFLVGHGEHRLKEFGNTGYSRIGMAMLNDNIDLKELLLTNKERVPKDAGVLIIAGPRKRLHPAEVEMIEEYLKRSGRVLVMLNAMNTTGLEPMLRRWGVKLRNDIVIDPENTLKGSDVYVKTYYKHPITEGLGGVVTRFYLPRSVEPVDKQMANKKDGLETVSELAITSKKSWSEMQFNKSSTRRVRFDPNTPDQMGPCCLALAIEHGAEQKILNVQIQPSRMVVIGDADFVCNNFLSGGNQDFYMSALNWLLDREELMVVAPKPLDEVKLNINQKQLGQLFILNVVVIPLIAVIGGLLIWFRRRK